MPVRPTRPRARRRPIAAMAVILGSLGSMLAVTMLAVTTTASAAGGAAVPRAVVSGPVALSSPLTGDLTLTGRGFGHGWGMSQVGAYGWAAQYGWSAEQILSHYYGGTVTGSVPLDTAVSVRLLAQNGRSTAVVQQSGHARLVGDAGLYAAMVARPVAAGSSTFEVWGHPAVPGCAPTSGDLSAAGWVLVSAGVVNPAFQWAFDDGSHAASSQGDLLGVCEADGGVRFYRGVIRAVGQPDPRNGATPGTVNEVRVDQYLRSVISKEMSPSWGTASNGGMAALEAQAVAARSYALASSYNLPSAQTCDTTRCQVYAGAARRAPGSASLSSNEHPLTDSAVVSTAGLVRRIGHAGGAVATTYYAAASGGWTDAMSVYPAVQDDADALVSDPAWAQQKGVSWATSWHRWTITLPVTRVEQAWPSIGKLTGFTVTQRNGLGEWGGRVRSMKIHGTAGEVTVTGNDFYARMGLRSNWFVIDTSSALTCSGNIEPPVTGPVANAPAARFSALTPSRIVDTRVGLGAPRGRLEAGCTIRVVPSLPAGATAAVVNVTTVNVDSRGFATAYPCGTPRPWISTSQTAPDRVTPATAVVPLGADGSFCVYSPTTTNVVVDLFGYYAPGASGRFSPVDPARIFDSRSVFFGGPGPIRAGTVVPVQIGGVAGVPASGVEAASVTVHALAGSQMSYVTAYPCDTAPPYTSLANVLPGQSLANHGQVRLDASGRMCIFVSGAIDVLVDVTGWFGPGGSSDYYAVQPERVVDSRIAQGVPARLPALTDTAVGLVGHAGVPAGARAVIATVTMVGGASSSYLTVHPCLSPVPGVSMTRNIPPIHAATAALVRLDASGRWCANPGVASHLLVDVVGWYG